MTPGAISVQDHGAMPLGPVTPCHPDDAGAGALIDPPQSLTARTRAALVFVSLVLAAALAILVWSDATGRIV